MAGAREGDSAAFNAVNRGKLGVVLDLRRIEGRDAFRRLALGADVLIENYRPGVMARLGLDYPTLSASNPRLVYASISGYGQTGPAAAKGGFDLVAQGASGIMSVTGEADRPPVKAGLPLTDLGAGLFALSAILGALVWRASSGSGQHIDTSLLDAGVALSVWEATEFFSGQEPQRLGSAHRMSAPYQAFRCADGYITVGAANDRTFSKLALALGHEEWVNDPRFATADLRVQHRVVLASLIEEITAKASREDWLRRLDDAGIPCGPINTYGEVFADPQVIARELAVEVDHPTLGRLRSLGTPIKMSATPLNPHRRAPLLGEHTDAVLRDAGFDDEEVWSLRSSGVTGTVPR
jgi:crotonobetainyl-CoA:carnitine CoA-transferase CaiB-like acyl-CoA transferase